MFATGPDTWALVVGDVCGKGPEAAALTALARYTLRAYVPVSPDPQDALRRLNDAMLRQAEDGRFVTLVYAALDVSDPQRPLLRVACAGHPPPIMVPARGRAMPLPVRGTFLGVTPDIALTQVEVPLVEGDALLLYSDGVTEAHRPRTESPAQLAGRITPAVNAEDLASEVERGALADVGVTRDDIAILVLRRDARSRRPAARHPGS